MYSLFRRVHLLVRRHGHILQDSKWCQAAHQGRTLCRARSARLARGSVRESEGCDHGFVSSLQEEASTEACQRACCNEETSKATVRCDSPRSPRVEGVLWPPSLWVESGSGSLATPRCAEPRKCSGAVRSSAEVRSVVSSPRTKKKSDTRILQRERACALCPHDWWNKSRMRHSHGFVPHECCTARASVDVATA